MSLANVFAVQDRTGTVFQLTMSGALPFIPEVNDTGVYHGLSWDGVVQALNFTVVQVNDSDNFCISTRTPTGAAGNILASSWPRTGTITWLTGENSNASPNETVIVATAAANCYTTVAVFEQYHNSRGNLFPASPVSAIEAALVKATDYLDQRYRYKGIKLFQFLVDNPAFDPVIGLIDPWIIEGGFGFSFEAMGGLGWLAPSATMQQTMWPRQGVVDYQGDNVYGIPQVIQFAVCEAALRVLNGTPLQPDYDPNVVTAGGVLQSFTNEVGPIRETRTYDTKLGLSFFPSIPQIDRMLRSAGILVDGGGRSLIR